MLNVILFDVIFPASFLTVHCKITGWVVEVGFYSC